MNEKQLKETQTFLRKLENDPEIKRANRIYWIKRILIIPALVAAYHAFQVWG